MAMAGKFKIWTAEEDAVLYANPEKCGSQLCDLLPDRTIPAINCRRKTLGLSALYPQNSRGATFSETLNRPLTDETAYHVRKDYAAKIKLGYTHEKAVDWLVKANVRNREVIEDILTNPKYDAQVARCARKARAIL